jgi:Phosphatase
LLEYLSVARIAGPVATPREANLANFRLMAGRDPDYLFGLEPRGAWTFDDVLTLMAQRCGVSPDPLHDSGADTIDAALTVERLEAMAGHLRTAAATKSRVLLATGHPTGVLVVHLEIARALVSAGCTLLTPPARWEHVDSAGRLHERHVRSVLGVSVASQGANLLHTHSPAPMELMLRALADQGEADLVMPDLVVADHGFAGAAGRAGVTCVGFADSNDPALFVGEAEGDVAVCVPLDDNVMPDLYAPLTSFLLTAAFG